jgi:hypothetical protein
LAFGFLSVRYKDTLGLKAYGEFGAKNTPQGWNTWLTFAISPRP